MQYTALVAGLLFLGGAAALTDQCTLNCGTADGTQPLICPNSCTQWSPLDNMFVDSCSSLSLSAGQTYRQPLPYYNILENLHIHSMESGTSFKYCVSSDGPPFNGQCSPNHLANPAKTGTLTDQDLTACVDYDISSDIVNIMTSEYANYANNLTTIWLDSYCPIPDLWVEIYCNNIFYSCNLAIRLEPLQNCTLCTDTSLLPYCEGSNSLAPAPLAQGYVLVGNATTAPPTTASTSKTSTSTTSPASAYSKTSDAISSVVPMSIVQMGAVAVAFAAAVSSFTL